MDEIKDFSDERQKSWCIHCGDVLARVEINRDHVPSKCFLKQPYPENLPFIHICVACNRSFALDEEYTVAFLGSVLVGSTNPELQVIPAAARILGRSTKLRARIDDSRGCPSARGSDLVWKPESERISRVIVKNARGHAYFEIGEPMLSAPTFVWVAPLQALTSPEKDQFEDFDMSAVWPEVGSRMLSRLVTGQDLAGSWVLVQDGVYRYGVSQNGGVVVRSVLYEYLATEVQWAD